MKGLEPSLSSNNTMKPLPNFNFDVLDTNAKALKEIEHQIRLLKDIIVESDYTKEDKEQLIINIKWLKRFYEAAERNLLKEK